MTKTEIQNLIETIAFACIKYNMSNVNIEDLKYLQTKINNDYVLDNEDINKFINILNNLYINHILNLPDIKKLFDSTDNIEIKNFLYTINNPFYIKYDYYNIRPNKTRAAFTHNKNIENIKCSISIKIDENDIKYFIREFLFVYNNKNKTEYYVFFPFITALIHELKHLYYTYKEILGNTIISNKDKTKYSNKQYINNKNEVDARLSEFLFIASMFKFDSESLTYIPIGYNEYAKKYINYCKDYKVMTDRNIKRGLRKLYKIYYDDNLNSKLSVYQENIKSIHDKIVHERFMKKYNEDFSNKIYNIANKIFSKIENIVKNINTKDDKK